jgi:hypothetical protein
MDELPARYAAVCVDHPLPQLNQLFDYRIPVELRDAVEPGCRVSVRFNNRKLKGTVLAVRDRADFSGKILPSSRSGSRTGTRATSPTSSVSPCPSGRSASRRSPRPNGCR